MLRPRSIAPLVSQGSRFAKLVACVALSASAAAVVSAPRLARADGAFPESYQLVLPADRPDQIVLATNFGLFISDDAGATWTWTCEQKATTNSTLYGVSAPPLDRFFSLSSLVGLAFSDDVSCSWTSSGGSLDTAIATDYFADPTNAMRVYAVRGARPRIRRPPARSSRPDDGGATFGSPIYTAPANGALQSVEIAQSDSKTIYVSMYTTPGTHPSLVRSLDGGSTWTAIDLEASLGANDFFIIAVDPLDAQTLQLRVQEPAGDSVAISHDGGMTFTKVLSIPAGPAHGVRAASTAARVPRLGRRWRPRASAIARRTAA